MAIEKHEVWAKYTSLTPSLFTKVPVPKVGGPVFVCRSIDFASFWMTLYCRLDHNIHQPSVLKK
jgi:hypothetical protein